MNIEEFTEALKAWSEAWSQIQQQDQHSWLLKGHISKEEAARAIEQAWQTADSLRELAERIETQAEMASGLLLNE